MKPRGAKPLRLDSVKVLVLDEADEFLGQAGNLKANSLEIRQYVTPFLLSGLA